MMEMLYPSLLRPTANESLVIGSQALLLPKAVLQLRRWSGEAIADAFGNKPLIDFAGRPLFMELAVYELFRLSGWEARWIETFGAPAKSPKYYTDWQPNLSKELRTSQLQQAIAKTELTELLQQIVAANGNSFAGCWDVLGWHGNRVIFAESKRQRRDKLRATQPRWLQAGLAAGLRPKNFLLVEWDFLADSTK